MVEDIQRCKVLLEIEDQDKQVVIEQLNQLEQKIPSKEVLEETKIGKADCDIGYCEPTFI